MPGYLAYVVLEIEPRASDMLDKTLPDGLCIVAQQPKFIICIPSPKIGLTVRYWPVWVLSGVSVRLPHPQSSGTHLNSLLGSGLPLPSTEPSGYCQTLPPCLCLDTSIKISCKVHLDHQGSFPYLKTLIVVT